MNFHDLWQSYRPWNDVNEFSKLKWSHEQQASGFPEKREREKQIALSSPQIISMLYTLSTSQRLKKKCLLSGKKIVFGALLNQQKIWHFHFTWL